jgi:hypothetical protein
MDSALTATERNISENRVEMEKQPTLSGTQLEQLGRALPANKRGADHASLGGASTVTETALTLRQSTRTASQPTMPA